MKCPRRAESPMISQACKREDDTGEDGKCLYCGSISQEQLFAAIESNCRIDPTDKDYKVYVFRINPRRGLRKVVSTCSYERPDYQFATQEDVDYSIKAGGLTLKVGDYFQYGPEPEFDMDKFYFPHLDDAGREKFIRLNNERKINWGAPGYLYVTPYFCKRGSRQEP